MQMCSIILAIVLLITAALSATALLACRYQFWTFLQDASASPPYTLRYASATPCLTSQVLCWLASSAAPCSACGAPQIDRQGRVNMQQVKEALLQVARPAL